MGIKVYRTFMHGIRICNNEELVSIVPYTKNGEEFIKEISNLIKVQIIDNVRYRDVPKKIEGDFCVRSLPFTYKTLPPKIKEKMFEKHEHAELLDAEEICYKESDVMDIINMIYSNAH